MNLRNLPRWLDGGLFGALMVPLIFFLKVMCPISTGCFADPFVVVMFSPLVAFELFITGEAIGVGAGIALIMIFWGVVVGVAAHLLSSILKRREQNSNSLTEIEKTFS